MKQVKASGTGHQTPGQPFLFRSPSSANRWLSGSLVWMTCIAVACMVAPSDAAVDLVWDPPSQTALQNTVVDVALYAVLDGSGLNPNIGVIEVILNWDPVKLELVGKIDNGPYPWLVSAFPNDALQDGLNAPYGVTPANDGNAWYNALSNLGAGNEAVATTSGLLVTTFQFRALALGTAEVSMAATAGLYTETRVLDGVIPGLVTTGQLGPPASITTNAGIVPASPVADTSADKTRFISFSPDNLGYMTALRVRLTSLHHPNPPYTGGPSEPFTSFEGQHMWVGPPQQYLESISSGVQFYASSLQCTPYYQDWGSISLLHVTGPAVVPSSVYDVECLASDCVGIEDTCTLVSLPVSIRTTRWGDVEIPYNPPITTVQPDVGDISALVNKFRSAPGAPIKARGLLTGVDAFGTINMIPDLDFTHIAACVDAFRGKPYPFKMGKCAGAPTPPASGACTTDLECTGPGANGAGPCNIHCP